MKNRRAGRRRGRSVANACRRPRCLHRRRLGVEALEDRRLLSTGVGSQAVELFGTSSALFVENQGQWEDPSVRYAFQGSGANISFTDGGPVFQLYESSVRETHQGEANYFNDDPFGALHAPYDEPDDVITRTAEFSVHFEGANESEPVGVDRAETVFNYCVGEQSAWRTAVPAYEQIVYRDLYEGIDLATWGRRDHLKYEFHVAPGADYRQIRVHSEGIGGLSLADDGSLRVALGNDWGELVDDAPYIYQLIDGQEVEVPGRFALVDAQTYAFTLTGPYDTGAELIIDPSLAWSTYLGGSDEDLGQGIAVDAAGNALVTGSTKSPGWVSGGFDTSHDGDYDAFVAKISVAGGHLWTTYLGGTDRDYGNGIAVDAAGNGLVTGQTDSPGWVSGGFNTVYTGNADAFVAKISGTGGHLWSTYLGGTDGDGGGAITVDASGNVLVAGGTASPGWVSGGFDTSFNGGDDDAFLAKISPAGGHLWSTYLGGTDRDGGHGVAVDGAGNVLVTGNTRSSGWVSGGFDTSYNGGGFYPGDVFVAKISPAGGFLWSTYLGGSNGEEPYAIAVDGAGNALVTGMTGSSGWVSGGFDTSFECFVNGFVAKISPEGGHLWSTYLGGSTDCEGGFDYGFGIAVDAAGNTLVSGETSSSGWISGGFDTSLDGFDDGFVAKISTAGEHLWSTYLGGSSRDGGRGIALDASGNVLVTGTTYSAGWVSGGFDTNHNGGRDVFVAKIMVDVDDVRPRVAGRHVFYNNSSWDGNEPAAGEADDDAIAPDKVPLLPGGTATFANYTSYSSGINGIMVDIAGLPGTPTADDFQFRVGNDNGPACWMPAPQPTSVTVGPVAGINGLSRMTLLWPDNAIQNQWLEVVVLATAETGLDEPDVFYFGNAIGESGNSTTDAKVNAFDMIGARNNQRNFLDPAPIDFPFDYNRDARVEAIDMLIARNHTTHFLNALNLITVPAGEGDGIVVSTAVDEDDGDYGPGDLSLREALVLAGESPGCDVITFDAALAGGTIELDPVLGPLEIDSNVRIEGSGELTVIKTAEQRVFVFAVAADVTAAMSGMTISGNRPTNFHLGHEGGIYNAGALTLTDCTVAGTHGVGERSAGIENVGTMTLVGCTITANVSNSGLVGGISNYGEMTLNDCTISDNIGALGTGGGVFNCGQMILTGCTISDNWHDAGGAGGIYNFDDGSIVISDCTISHNRADSGGGIMNSGTMTIGGSTISENVSFDSGGGIDNRGELTIVNSTICGNTSEMASGGGVFNRGPLTIINTTIVDNQSATTGGGIHGRVTLHNSIVAGNTPDDVPGPDSLAPGSSNNLIGGDPMLGPLADNGGPTLTHALLPGSPAIDAGSNDRAHEAGLVYDQRGLERFLDGNGDGTATVDIGAYEYGPIVVSTADDENDGDHGPGDLSLREALALAAELPGDDVIEFAGSLAGSTITLDPALGSLDVNSDVDVRGPGGGLTVDANGNVRAFHVRFQAEASIHGLTVTGGVGNCICNAGTLTLGESTISGNRAGPNGGIVTNDGVLTAANVTISGNSGRGIVGRQGTVTLINATITDNSAESLGVGIYSESAEVTLHNTIVAGNSADGAAEGHDVYGPFNSASSYNLIGVIDGSTGLDGNGTLFGTAASPLAPLLGPLADNGGPTLTRALLPGSPAIDAGDNVFATATDQRGFSRIEDGDGDGTATVDIGAYEYGPTAKAVRQRASAEPGDPDFVLRRAVAEALANWDGSDDSLDDESPADRLLSLAQIDAYFAQ